MANDAWETDEGLGSESYANYMLPANQDHRSVKGRSPIFIYTSLLIS